MNRHFSPTDRLISHADNMLRTLFAPAVASRPSPAKGTRDQKLSSWEENEAGRLMRVNHTGEVCAQALYQGQSLTTRNEQLRETFREAADEETDHLAWCEERIKSLNSRTSRLNPLFYAGSFAIGAVVGLLGDRTSAAFLAETEHQVVEHLDRQMGRLPASDASSRDILQQMREDELKHATTAEEIGTTPMSEPARGLMRRMSKVMTGLSYWV